MGWGESLGEAGGSRRGFRLLDGNWGLLSHFQIAPVSLHAILLVLPLRISSRIRFQVHIQIKKGGSLGNGRATQTKVALENNK